MKRWLRHAFAIEPAGPACPDERERQVVERLVAMIVARRLTTPALLLLECSHPLNFIISQFLVFVGPLARVIFPPADYDTLVRFLDRRGSIEYICRQIEAVDAGAVDDRASPADRSDEAR